MVKKLLLTGAFGNIGSSTIAEVKGGEEAESYELTCFDVETPRNKIVHAKLAKKYKYEVVWGNLADKESIKAAIEKIAPDAVLHLAAIIPPVAYIRPKLAEAINVDGTRYIMDICDSMENKPRIVFASSYSACGSHNGAKEAKLQTPETPMEPGDLYGHQKMRCEKMLKNYSGKCVILRFGAILPLEFGTNMMNKATLQFAFSIPGSQRRHGADSRDVGLAVLRAGIRDGVDKKILMIGGDDTWKRTVGELMTELYAAMGISVKIPETIYRRADPENTRTWYFEEWMDTRESQELLQFQRHTLQDYLKTIKKKMGLKRLGAKAFARVVRMYFVKASPYYAENMRTLKAERLNASGKKTPSDLSPEVSDQAEEKNASEEEAKEIKATKSFQTMEFWDILRFLYPAAPENYILSE